MKLKALGWTFSKDKEEDMAKKRVKFQVQDGVKPERMGDAQSLTLRSPLQMTIPPGQQRQVKLGVTCSHPLQLFRYAPRGLDLVSTGVAESQAPLTLVLENRSNAPIYVERGEALALAHVLDDTDVVLE